MRPALSIILFTTLSGAGYGLWFVLGLVLAVHAGHAPLRTPVLAALAIGFALSTTGLLCSVGHLGKPLRAWRALSQWRSSWLSREGIAAIACAFVALATAALVLGDGAPGAQRVAGLALAVNAIVVVFCTARIYTSLPTIAAWHDARVLPAFLALAFASGATWWWWVMAAGGGSGARAWPLVALAGLLVAVACKLAYWRRPAEPEAAAGTGHATGLDRFGDVRSVEAPHTEANYLTHEMGFVLARRHAARLRAIALGLLGGVAGLAALGAAAWPVAGAWLAGVAVAATALGAFVERWLFFAEARHAVMRYYGSRHIP